jgi:putative PEP-CTERM system histidine kinase
MGLGISSETVYFPSMSILAFIFISFIASAILLLLNCYKSGMKSFHPPLIALCLLYPASFFCAFTIYPLGRYSPLWMKWFVSFSFAATWCIIDLLDGFHRHHTTVDRADKTRKKLDRTAIWRIFLPIAGVLCFLISDSTMGLFRGSEILVLNAGTRVIFILQLFMQIYILYIIENTFRFANAHERRIGSVFLISLLAVTLYQTIFLTRALLFKTLFPPYLTAYITITGICFPIALLGLLRVRVGSYEIGISRQSVYSSMSIIAFGSFCLAVGTVSFIIRRLNLEFTFFEAFLFLFSALFFGILALLSGDIRRRIRSFVNNHIFARKFDYREQFFWLHHSYMAGEDVDGSIAVLTAHLLNTLNYDKIFVFLINYADGNYHLHKDRKNTEEKSDIIPGDSPIVKEFLRDKSPLEFSGADRQPRENAILAQQRETIESLGITAIFPIFHQSSLLGFLAVKYHRSRRLDIEDKTLIAIFTVSIGNVFFKYTLLKENIENKQFESFNRLAAFLVHDIKNQVATLSLILKNADRNIDKPDFQKSLILSIQSCADNLQKLVDKLARPPKSDQLHANLEDINAIVMETVAATGVSALRDITLTSFLQASGRVLVDKESLYYILKNLIVNALEAMNYKGTLTIVTGDPNASTEKLCGEFNIGDHFLQKFKTYISLEDTGVGMSEEFIDQRLFKPFSTTKDKGIGIGLYQCKILVEKMGGTLLCVSRPGQGTMFCILL